MRKVTIDNNISSSIHLQAFCAHTLLYSCEDFLLFVFVITSKSYDLSILHKIDQYKKLYADSALKT